MAEVLRPLVEAAQAGDRKALNELARCVDRFLRIFSGSVPRQVRARHGSTLDFVCEGLAEAFAELRSFEYKTDEQFYGWIARAIRNRMVDAWRQENSQKRSSRRTVSLDGEGIQAAADDLTASVVVSGREMRDEVGRHILELQLQHPDEMEVVLLKIFEGKSWAQIRDLLVLSSDRRARTLFANGIDLLRPRIERALGETALDRLLESGSG